MPEDRASRRADRAWQRRGLAAWFAALLALAPVARPSLPIDPGAGGQLSALPDDGAAGTSQPAAKVQPAQPVGLGILCRLSAVETAFGPASAKSPFHRPRAADEWAAVSDPTDSRKDAARAVFERSSVGTARTPTGPPV